MPQQYDYALSVLIVEGCLVTFFGNMPFIVGFEVIVLLTLTLTPTPLFYATISSH
jgi:hypothetical protein